MTAAVITSHAVNVPFILVPDTGNKTTSPVHASIFHDSDSTGTAIPDVAGPSYSTKQDLSMGSQELNTETFHQIREMDYHYLYMEFNVGTARQACLNAEVRMRTDYCLIERSRKLKLRRNVALENKKDSLNGKVTELQSSVSAKDLELKDLNVAVCIRWRLHVPVSVIRFQQIKEFQDAQMNVVNDKVAKLDADLLEMALHL
ncbi:hypothetical protein Tco_1558976 [Tanacetum coccineum]